MGKEGQWRKMYAFLIALNLTYIAVKLRLMSAVSFLLVFLYSVFLLAASRPIL